MAGRSWKTATAQVALLPAWAMVVVGYLGTMAWTIPQIF